MNKPTLSLTLTTRPTGSSTRSDQPSMESQSPSSRARYWLVAAALALACGQASAVILDFSELPFQSVDDLTISGVTFDFKVGGVDSLDAYYGSGGPGSITYVQDPSLEGDAVGILTLDFSSPTSVLSFGVALSTLSALTPGFTVELFDASLISLGVTAVNTIPLIDFTEALFNYSGTPIARAVLDFDDATGRFAMDNLTLACLSQGLWPCLVWGWAALATYAVRRCKTNFFDSRR